MRGEFFFFVASVIFLLPSSSSGGECISTLYEAGSPVGLLYISPKAVVALIMGKNGEKMDFGYGKTFLEKVSWGGPETPFCGISGPIPACGGVYTEKWTKF